MKFECVYRVKNMIIINFEIILIIFFLLFSLFLKKFGSVIVFFVILVKICSFGVIIK